MTLKYNDKRPTEPGWYWYVESHRGLVGEVVEVCVDGDGLLSLEYCGIYTLVSSCFGQFAGPIEKPEG